jgi:hypothetical protein
MSSFILRRRFWHIGRGQRRFLGFPLSDIVEFVHCLRKLDETVDGFGQVFAVSELAAGDIKA